MKYNKNNPLRVFTAFSGYDSQSIALERLKEDYPEFDFVRVGWSEFDPQSKRPIDEQPAVIANRALFPDGSINYGDICKIDWAEVPDFDLFTYSFPCCLAGTIVRTFGGYRKIEEIQEGDIVLTHKNRYRMVSKTMSRNAPNHYIIKAPGCSLKLTGEHPLLVRRNDDEQWIRVQDLKEGDYISYNIPNEINESNLTDDYLWLLGRYVADGWVNPLLYKSVEFAIAEKKEEEFLGHIPSGLTFKKAKKSCLEYRIADEKLQTLCYGFGSGSINKHIPKWVYDLPSKQIKIFLDGYLSGDGYVRYKGNTKIVMFSTVSKELFCGIQSLFIKAYGKVCSLTIRKDNRKETYNDTYNGQIAFSEITEQKRIGDKIWVPIKSIEKILGSVRVFNLSVEDDESYTCDNVNSHNCTDISNAGRQAGLEKDSGTRSSLLWECEKAIEIKRPKYLLMENVKALFSKKFRPFWNDWVDLLNGYGYKTFAQVLNSKNYGTPQNRERVFGISILRTENDPEPVYNFPAPFPLTTCLADVLEEEVDEKYFLSDEMLARFCVKSVEEESGKD